MRRVLVWHGWKAKWWDARRNGCAGLVSSDLADGIRAYACRQAHMHRRFVSRFTALWSTNPITADIFNTTAQEDGDDDDDEEEEEEEEEEVVDTSGVYV
jgi:hypothetical protein